MVPASWPSPSKVRPHFSMTLIEPVIEGKVWAMMLVIRSLARRYSIRAFVPLVARPRPSRAVRMMKGYVTVPADLLRVLLELRQYEGEDVGLPIDGRPVRGDRALNEFAETLVVGLLGRHCFWGNGDKRKVGRDDVVTLRKRHGGSPEQVC